MSSFIAAGTAYATHGINMIPFFIYYSMFGFQRIGDLIWAAARHARAKGFLLGGTAGRTTLTGEGLQHQDGHSLLNRHGLSDDPGLRPGLRLRDGRRSCCDGMQRMYEDGEDAIYYITLHNENYRHAADARRAVEEGIIRGMYKFSHRRRRLESAHACNCSAAARSSARRCGRRRSWPSSTTFRATCGA